MTVCGEKVTGVCAIGKCPHIKRCCPVVWDKYGKIKPMTNEEWFDSLTTNEKAYHLADICAWAMEEFRCGNTEKSNIDYWEEWLKEKHNGNT